MRKSRKAIVIGGTVGALLVGGAAFAYWSTSGDGTGSAATSAGAPSLVVTETSNVTNMFPGDSAQNITGTVKNTAANSAYVTKVVVSIASVTQASGATGSCDSSDYTLDAAQMAVNKDIAAGATEPFSGATIQFKNKPATNQDGCKGATVHLAYAAS